MPYTTFISRFRSPSMPPMPISTNSRFCCCQVHKLEGENKALRSQLGMLNGSDDNVFSPPVSSTYFFATK